MDVPNYTREEEIRIRTDLDRGESPSCPRCGTSLETRDVPPRSEVSYVRHRVWLFCANCRRSLVVDLPEEP